MTKGEKGRGNRRQLKKKERGKVGRRRKRKRRVNEKEIFERKQKENQT